MNQELISQLEAMGQVIWNETGTHMAGPTVDRRPLVTRALLGDISRFFRDGSLTYEINRQYALAMTQ